MALLSIQKYVQYCEGRGYFNRRKFDEDYAHEHRVQRLLNTQKDLDYSQDFQAMLFARNATPKELVEKALQPVQIFLNFGTGVYQILSWPLKTAYELSRALLEQMLKLSNPETLHPRPLTTPYQKPAEGVLASLISFFFGYKKHRIEENLLRDKDDFAQTDLFTRYMVQETQEQSDQSGSHR